MNDITTLCLLFLPVILGIIFGTICFIAPPLLDALADDRDLKQQAKEGQVLLLTYEQFMALEAADPKKYSLEGLVCGKIRGKNCCTPWPYHGQICLLRRDMKAAQKEYERRKEKAQKVEQTTYLIGVAQECRATLEKDIEQNEAVCQQAAQDARNILQRMQESE